MLVRHNKTGKLYAVFMQDIIECTNGREDNKYVLYANEEKIFCREQKEFWKKFKPVKEE